MLVQGLLLVATLLIVAASILTETLVAAKAGFHATMAATTQTATADATTAFVRWAQGRVTTYGASNAKAWPPQSAPEPIPNVCPAATPAGGGGTPAPCALAALATWQIRGATSAGDATLASPPPGTADAQNLAPTINEQRVAATIAVRITDPTGRTTFADRTREVTARIFEASPYVVITGTRDVTAEAGTADAGEGDTAGVAQYGDLYGNNFSSPNPEHPAAGTDTRIRTSVDCVNSAPNENRGYGIPARAGQINYSFHPYGNQDWAYELPCDPPNGPPTPPPGLNGYLPPQGTLYATEPDQTRNNSWNPGTQQQSVFPR